MQLSNVHLCICTKLMIMDQVHTLVFLVIKFSTLLRNNENQDLLTLNKLTYVDFRYYTASLIIKMNIIGDDLSIHLDCFTCSIISKINL